MSTYQNKLYHKLVTEFEDKVMEKYAYTPSNSFRLDEGLVKGRSTVDVSGNPVSTRYRKYNAVSKSMSYSSYRRRMGEVTATLVQNLMDYAPFATGYGRSHMWKKIDRFNGNIELGSENPHPGQTANAPYMVHQNVQSYPFWIESAIAETQDYAEALRINIWQPKYYKGLAILKCRASEQDDAWYEDAEYQNQ